MTTLEDAHRTCWPEVLAATVRVTRDLDLAEDCVQEAYLRSMAAWRTEAPINPAAWLTTTARRVAIDWIRREQTLRDKLPLLVMDDDGRDEDPGVDLLRLVFTCCHPALSRDAQVALTLRLLGGLSVVEIAAGLLQQPSTIAARITRAKKKILAAGIPFRVPSDTDLADRVDVVLETIHLIHTAGHTAADGTALTRPDLSSKARDLAGMLARLLPDNSEVTGLLALCLLTDARTGARSGDDGVLLLAEQDRRRWDRRLIVTGLAAATRALDKGTGRYALQGAIAGLHAQAPDLEHTDWPAIVCMYDGLLNRWPTPVVELNRLVARSMLPSADLSGLLAELEGLSTQSALQHYQYLPAVRADLLFRLGRTVDAARAYAQALALTRNEVEAAFLEKRLRECGEDAALIVDDQ